MVRTRIAPSPTGLDLHIGSIYAALINFVFAKKNNGKFIIRIEDTDRTRLVPGAQEKFLSVLKQYGINYDEGPDKDGKFGPYTQSGRLEIYNKYAKELIEKKKAYYCICTKERLDQVHELQKATKQITKYNKYCFSHQAEAVAAVQKGVPHVVRLTVPENRDITFHDLIHGDITINTNTIDDQILLKTDGFPTYHLALVVDDYLMQISHVIRGEEWISSTPKHILLYEAFGFPLPIFAHIPLLRNPDKSKLSKRKNPVWASWFLEQGFLPEAILNYLALMGWSHPEQKEIFSLEEFIRVFRLEDMQPVGPAFDMVKLEWMNGMYIRQMDNSMLLKKITDFTKNQFDSIIVQKTIPLIKERIKKLSEYTSICGFFFTAPTRYEIDLKKYASSLAVIRKNLQTLISFTAIAIGEAMQKTAKEVGMKNSEFFQMLRVAISGKKISPPLNESMALLGKDECVKRITRAISS